MLTLTHLAMIFMFQTGLVSQMAVHTLSLALILSSLYFAWPFTDSFSWHPLLMTIGIFGFVMQGIILYNNDSSLVLGYAKRHKVSETAYYLN